MRTAFLQDRRFEEHLTGEGHPERPERLQASLRLLGGQAWFASLAQIEAAPAELDWIEHIHDLGYIRRAEALCGSGAPWIDTPDVAVCPRSFDVALLAAGGGMALADAVIAGDADNAFALVRPPGHHAEQAAAMGFCVFNNVAVLARYLQKAHGLDKIAIVDWDVHHGNGTQHSFEEDPSVFYVSLHQYPHYPGTGSADETGRGRGRGTTLNCPMRAGANDSAYERAFMEQVLPALDLYRPEAVIISAGFDAHRDDPLADIELSTACYGWMTTRMLEVADQHAGGRVISMLEGGYHLNRLAECVTTHLAVLCGQTGP
jgi:acetoin utilization deacetylase AcuC-like enzyme